MKKFSNGIALCLVIFCIFLGAKIAPAQEETKTKKPIWSPALSMQYHTINGVTMSPNGTLLAYVIRKPVMKGEKSSYLSHIWVATVDGKTNLQYTRGDKSATSPAFSPDGRYLAFLSARGGKQQVWAIRLLGGEATQITTTKSGVSAFKWSPDGKSIAFTMRDAETKEEKKSKKEKRFVILVNKQFKYNHLYVTDSWKDRDGKQKVRKLTTGKIHVNAFDWSPDGKTITFAHQPDPRINTFFKGLAVISIISADGGAIKPLVTSPGVDNDPQYSPDGLWIAFTSFTSHVGLSDIFVIPAAGGKPRKLADTPDRNARLIGWSADGKQVFISERYRTLIRVYGVPVDGRKPAVVTNAKGVVDSVAFNKATDRMAFTYETSDMPVDIYTSMVQPFAMKKLTSIHKGVPRPPMGRTEVIRWKSFDGKEIEGLLTYPVGYKKGKTYPFILNIHGGPRGMYAQSFTGAAGTYMIQYFAQNGYAVLRPNPRGSTGYGKDFRYAVVKDWGYGDYEDVMSGVDTVIEMGVANPNKMAVMGWSYGGYLTSFLVTRTHRFKAASIGAGLTNLISMHLTNDIPDGLAAHMGGDPWDDYARYEKHSAIYRIKNVKTPSQILHGERDNRVPTTQGYEFYNALYRLGVPTEMVVYPRTPHGPREPKLLMDVSPRIRLWFDRHVLGKKTVVAKQPEKALP